jgi:hypothetical protein
MKTTLITLGLFLLVSAGLWLPIGCTPAGLTKATIEVSDTYSESCAINVDLDGSNLTTVTNTQLFTFPLVNPGNHTLNFSSGSTNTCGGNPPCSYENSAGTGTAGTFSLNFNITGGNVYEATVTAFSGNCNIMSVTGS